MSPAHATKSRRSSPTTTPTTTTTPTGTGTTPGDADHDGYADAGDCAPGNAAVHPRAPDLPDRAYVDSNCDGIDGTESDAIFVSPLGSDGDSGQKERPKRQIQAAVSAAAGRGKYVLVAAGSYSHVWQGGSKFNDVITVANNELSAVAEGKESVSSMLSKIKTAAKNAGQ